MHGGAAGGHGGGGHHGGGHFGGHHGHHVGHHQHHDVGGSIYVPVGKAGQGGGRGGSTRLVVLLTVGIIVVVGTLAALTR